MNPHSPLEVANERHRTVVENVEHEVRQLHGASHERTPRCLTCIDPHTQLYELYPCPTLRVVRKLVRMSRS